MHRKIFLMVLLMFACSEDELALEGRDFRLQSAEGYELVAGTTMYVRFRDGNLSAGADCNSMGGEYTVRDDTLIVSELFRTERGCETQAHYTQDEWLSAFLLAKPALKLDENVLVLRAKGATLSFLDREVADPDRDLVGALWTVDSFLKDDAVSNLPSMRDPTIEFRADGSYQVDTTCNVLSGRYQVRGERVVLSNQSGTDASCGGAANVADAHLQQLFGRSELPFAIEARRLTLGDNSFGIAARVD